ncbi:hypothetical protein [Brevundimonas aurantiaca]|jgi:hypothetical protein
MSRPDRPAPRPNGSTAVWIGVAVLLWFIIAAAAYGAARVIAAFGA